MLQPKKTKYRKQQKGKNRGLALRGSKVSFGEYGLKATSRGRLTARQIESARRAMTRHIKRGGKVWIRVFPDVPITKKPLEVRQGKGKGNVEYWVAKIQPGKVLYEMEGVEEDIELKEFSDEIEQWIIDEFKKIGCDTAKSVLELSVQELSKRTDLEEETILEIRKVLTAEFSD